MRKSNERSQQSLLPILYFHLRWKILSVSSLYKIRLNVTFIIYRLFSGQMIPYCANTFSSEEHSDRLLTVSDQQNPNSVWKYSPGQKNNVVTTLSRALPQRYFADFEQACSTMFTNKSRCF